MIDLLRLVQGSGPGSSRRSVRSKRRQFSIEPLECRVLPTIVWANRGTASSDTDGFNSSYGTNAAVARAIVNHAISDWNATIVSSTVLNVTISGANLASGLLGTTDNIVVSGGRPIAARIRLDLNASGGGWYMDTGITSDAEFGILSGPFSGTSATVTTTDFYTTVAHELGHALGIANVPGLAINQYLSPAVEGLNQTPVPGFLTFNNPNAPNGVRETLTTSIHLTDPNDLMYSSIGAGQRRLISTRAMRILRDAYGYGFQNPATRDTMHVNASSNSITVTPRAGTFNDSVVVDVVTVGGVRSLRFVVNGTTEIVPDNGGTTTLNGGDGNDELIVDTRTGGNVGIVNINGGSGSDVGVFQWNDSDGYYIGVDEYGVDYLYLHTGPSPAGVGVEAETLVLIGGPNADGIYVGQNNFQLIQVYGQGGNDLISGAPPLATFDPVGRLERMGYSTTPLLVFGGDGNDQLIGGHGSDILVGGTGNDVLTGLGGRDIMIGGSGVDEVGGVNAGDEDIVFGGTTIFDNDESALWDIRREWISSRTRSQRMANLSGTGSGTRSNGSRYLIMGTTVFPGTYLVGPLAYDVVLHETGIDWLFA